MAMQKAELLDWLNTLPSNAVIGVAEEGLALIVLNSDAYLELGGLPEEDEG